jgi:glycosyltransferase involved in cell wall biosynthesis
MITILYPFRNRELSRIKCSLDSLSIQKQQNFKVIFVDYGSKPEVAVEVEKLVGQYSFVSYHYLYTEHQPWNKAKALNFAIKIVDTEYCFIADVDIIFHNEFIDRIIRTCDPNKAIYFQVGYLSKDESKKDLLFENFTINYLSTHEATGMTLFSVNRLKEISGYDEFFHFWGSEDTDVHNRLANAGCETVYYHNEILLLHQWHESYHSNEKIELTVDLQLSNVILINSQHLFNNKRHNRTIVNGKGWGMSLTKSDYDTLESSGAPIVVLNKIEEIDDFLFSEIVNSKGQILSMQFKEDPFQKSLKYKVKKILGLKVPMYYTLKEINDKVLLHLISFYRDYPYSYVVSDDLKSLQLKLKKD